MFCLLVEVFLCFITIFQSRSGERRLEAVASHLHLPGRKKEKDISPTFSKRLFIRVRHRGAVPPRLKKSNLAEFSQGETEKSDLNPEFRRAGVAAG